MYTLDDFNAEKEKDPKFRAVKNDMSAELSLMSEIMSARAATGITQQQLSKKTGISQADISRIENANTTPSLRTIKRIADGFDMNVEIKFVPRKKQ